MVWRMRRYVVIQKLSRKCVQKKKYARARYQAKRGAAIWESMGLLAVNFAVEVSRKETKAQGTTEETGCSTGTSGQENTGSKYNTGIMCSDGRAWVEEDDREE